MEASLERTLGIHDDALRLRGQRANLLASNIANADVPGFKARDVDFKTVLAQASERRPEKLYRMPLQPTLDGNTVDSQVENALFAQNTMQYQASLQLLSSKFRSLRFAIKGQ